MKRRKFFTMIELLAAVALMVLLAGIGFAGYSYAMNSAKESATKSLIARIGAGLEAVRAKHGFYPTTKNGSGYEFFAIQLKTNDTSGIIEKIIFTKLDNNSAPTSVNVKWDASSENTNTELQKAHKEYIKTFLGVVDAETLKKYVNKQTNVLEDAWGGTVYYCYPGKVNKEKFDLVAPGTDGTFGTANAAVPSNSLADYQNSGNEWACDDIANFQ